MASQRTAVMVPRRQKLIAAGAVLMVGFAAALLFRRHARPLETYPDANLASSAGAPVALAPFADTILAGQPSPTAPTPAANANLVLGGASTPTSEATQAPPTETTAQSSGRPVYATVGYAPPSDAERDSPYRIYVVHDGDTLERLAERYLGDGSRSLELFDLNRDVLENPHLLTIGVELRIPTGESSEGNVLPPEQD